MMRAEMVVLALPFWLWAQTTAIGEHGQISGRVVNIATGEGIPRARVTIQLPTTGGEPDVRAMLTDAGGAFTIRGLSPNTYAVQAERPGYLSQGRSGAIETRVAVRLGETASVVLPLTPAAVLTGSVRDETGTGVPDGTVSVLRRTAVEGHRTVALVASGQTDTRGEFRVPQLDPGRYLIATTAKPGHAMRRRAMVYAPVLHPGVSDVSAAAVIALEAGQEMALNLRIPQVRARRVICRVLPLAPEVGHSLALEGAESVPIEVSQSYRLERTTGMLELPSVAPGAYRLYLRAMMGRREWTAKLPILVGYGELNEVTAVLSSGPPASGSMRWEGAQSPPGETYLTWQPVTPGPDSALEMQVQPDGTLSIRMLQPGLYRLRAPLPSPFYLRSATLAGQPILVDGLLSVPAGVTGPLEMVASARAAQLDFRVEWPEKGAELAVRLMLLRRGGERLTQVQSLLARASGEAWPGEASPATRSEPGWSRLAGLSPGSYLLCGWPEGTVVAYAEPEVASVLERRCRAVSLSEGESARASVPILEAAAFP